MGFKVTRAEFPLDFKGTQYEGMECTMRRPSLDALADISRVYGVKVDTMTEEDAAAIARVLDHFVKCLVRWNVEIDIPDPAFPDDPTRVVTVPVPANAEGVGMVDDYFLLPVVHIWLKFLQGDDVSKADIPQETLPGMSS